MVNENNEQGLVQPEPVVIPAPPPVVQVEQPEEVIIEEAPAEEESDEFSDITGLDEEDREKLFGTDGVAGGVDDVVDADIDDLMEVSDEDLFGESESPQPKKVKITRQGKRIIKRQSPPASMGGIGY